MEGNYEVFFGEQAIGRVQVIREGLYYRFRCRCKLTGEVVCKLTVSCPGNEESLGVLVPMGDSFGLETRLPTKRLGEGTPKFRVMPNRVVMPGKFIPIKPEEPFAYISRLKEAFLVRRNGQIGIVIEEI